MTDNVFSRRTILQDERDALETLHVNARSPELMKYAAPETYDVLRHYFDSRLTSLDSN